MGIFGNMFGRNSSNDRASKGSSEGAGGGAGNDEDSVTDTIQGHLTDGTVFDLADPVNAAGIEDLRGMLRKRLLDIHYEAVSEGLVPDKVLNGDEDPLDVIDTISLEAAKALTFMRACELTPRGVMLVGHMCQMLKSGWERDVAEREAKTKLDPMAQMREGKAMTIEEAREELRQMTTEGEETLVEGLVKGVGMAGRAMAEAMEESYEKRIRKALRNKTIEKEIGKPERGVILVEIAPGAGAMMDGVSPDLNHDEDWGAFLCGNQVRVIGLTTDNSPTKIKMAADLLFDEADKHDPKSDRKENEARFAEFQAKAEAIIEAMQSKEKKEEAKRMLDETLAKGRAEIKRKFGEDGDASDGSEGGDS